MFLDNYAYNNRLRDVHPGEKLIFALITLAIGYIPSVYSSSLIVIMMAVMVVIVAGVSIKAYLKLMLVPMFFLGTSLLTLLISFGASDDVTWIDFTLWGTNVGITYGSIEMAGVIFFRSLAMISCLYFISFTTPILDLISVLKKLKAPSVLTDLMLLIYRYLSVLTSSANDIYTSQDSRLGYFTFKGSLTSLGKLISGLFVKSCSDAGKLYTALASRGYDGELVVLEQKYAISWRNILFIITVDSLLLFIALKSGGCI